MAFGQKNVFSQTLWAASTLLLVTLPVPKILLTVKSSKIAQILGVSTASENETDQLKLKKVTYNMKLQEFKFKFVMSLAMLLFFASASYSSNPSEIKNEGVSSEIPAAALAGLEDWV